MGTHHKYSVPVDDDDDDDEELLLSSSNGLEDNTRPRQPVSSSEGRRISRRWERTIFQGTMVANIIILLVNLWLFIELMKRSSKLSIWDSTIYSPAQEAVAFESRPVDGLAEHSIYAGYPTPESDAAWNALMEGINLKIFPEEMTKLSQTSLEMRDGTGYLAVLGVYHELHCVKRLRKWFYRDYYYPNSTALEYNERMTHAEHCLEFIRQAAMCHGDITVTPFKWLHDAAGKVTEPTTQEGALHRCVRWDKLSSWAKSRRVDLFDPKLLKPEDH
ncbi:hypothetical protein GQX73_g4495 [Xylaria multiplex]|uniref:Tat pathway signal sequence n=1 Tax=Xylaria multiplex TaxID=323545 RepID=A0A7C8ISF0_9PEZI|nr:hypothetical protein GQX73_g4495 [Xylaria multiplex]